MAVLLPNGKQYYTDSATGLPLVGGKVYTYAAGTSTPKDTYTTAAAVTPNANPVILDARGEATIFWHGAYKIVAKDALDNLIWTVDNIDTTIDIADITYNGVALSTILSSSLTTVVDSITALKAVLKTAYTSAYVTGYYAAGDGGGGHYYYDSTDTTSSDNGGTIIVANDSARWKLLTNGQAVSVLQFGAKPDYTTDATTAIQAAINWLGAAGGVISLDGSFLIGNLTINANVTLKGNNGAPAQSATGTYSPATVPSVLVLPSANTITMKQGARLEAVTVINQQYSPAGTYALPLVAGNAVAAVGAYAGTAITPYAGALDIEVFDCMILGFQYAIKTGAGGNHYALLLDHVFMDCTNGVYLYSGYQTDASFFRDCRCEPYLTAHLADSTKDARTGTGFYDGTVRVTYEGCRVREWAIGFCSDNSSAHHLACFVYNYGAVNSKIGYKYITGGLSVYNTDCTAWNCGSGCIYSNLPVISEAVGIVITGGDFYNATPVESADGLVYIVDGHYSITDCQFGHNTTYGYIKLGAGADEGTIDNCSFYGQYTPVFGDAAALLLMRLGNVIYKNGYTAVRQPLTWTPVLKAGANVQTLSSSYGHFTITNQHATCYFDITVSAKVATGTLTITGLPYTAANETDSMLGMGCVTYYANTALLTSSPTLGVEKNTAIADLYNFAAGGVTVLDNTNLTNTTRLVGWVTYRIY